MSMAEYLLAERINSEVNASMDYVSDDQQYGVPEHWAVAVTAGDCEDYALVKFAALRAAGVPLEKLRLACVWAENNLGYHAVLVVTCGASDWVLDNRHPKPFATWAEKGYRLDKIWSHTLNAWEGA